MEIALDVETENLGADVFADNTRLLSVQIGNDKKQEVYWADATDPGDSLAAAKKQLESLLIQRVTFAGYNITRFDLPMIKQFLTIEIPQARVLEMTDMEPVLKLKEELRKRGLRLDVVCERFGVPVLHKQKMMDLASELRRRPDIITKANELAPDIKSKKSGSLEYAVNEALDNISLGMAIHEEYEKFAANGGQKDSFFYEYAVGDVISEYQLLQVLKSS